MKQLILGLGHKARHGKDSFLGAINAYYARQAAAASRHALTNYKPVIIQRLAFSDPLYREVNDFLSSKTGKMWIGGVQNLVLTEIGGNKTTYMLLPSWVTPDDVADDPRAPHGKYAKLLQWWGTDFRRNNFGLDYWTKQWKAAINPNASIVVAPDMRFLNELETIKEVGGYTFYIRRLNQDGTTYVDPSRDPNHPSETDLDGANHDFYITVKTGDLVLLEEIAITYTHFLRART